MSDRGISWRVIACACLALVASSWGFSSPPVTVQGDVTIQQPESGTNLVDGVNVSVNGFVTIARARNSDDTAWSPLLPSVLIEFYYSSVGTKYLINPSTVGVSFADDKTTTGGFQGSVGVKQVNSSVYPYFKTATGLTSLNQRTSAFDSHDESVVKP